MVLSNSCWSQSDAVLLNVISPSSGAYLGDEDVTVEIYNNGQYPISGFPIFYSLDGGTPVLDLFIDTLNPGESDVFTFEQKVNLSSHTTYNLCVQTGLPSDWDHENNAMCIIIYNVEGDMLTCMTAFPYQYVNDPPVYGSTAYAYDFEWWRVIIPVEMCDVSFSLCGSSYDTELSVYDDCNEPSIAYNDDYCGLQSKIVFSMLSAGTYYLKVGGYGSYYGSYILSVSNSVGCGCNLLSDITQTDVQCYGGNNGSIELSLLNILGTPPYAFLWSNGSTTQNISSLSEGEYWVTITDASYAFCDVKVRIDQTNQLEINQDITNPCSSGCSNGQILVEGDGGTPPYNYMWANGYSGNNPTGLIAGTYSFTMTDSNGCSLSDSVELTEYGIPPPWQYTITQNIHSIFILEAIPKTINGVHINPGDFLGVFYDSSGVDICGGYVQWKGKNSVLNAFGSDSVYDGFIVGDEFLWKIWKPLEGSEVMAYASYYQPPVFTEQGMFVPEGISAISSLTAENIDIQNINLPAGWSLISTYMSPVNTDIDSIFNPVISDLIICKNENGSAFWPLYNVDLIGNISIGEAYLVKMMSNQILPVEGIPVVPEFTSINLPQGWSYLGYLRQSAVSITDMLNSIVQDLIIIKDDNGNAYWPAYNVNLIGNMIPGEGYQIKMYSAQMFFYPPN